MKKTYHGTCEKKTYCGTYEKKCITEYMMKKGVQEGENPFPAIEKMEKKDRNPYDNFPKFTKNSASKLHERLNQGMTVFLVIAGSIVFYFAFLRFGHVSDWLSKIFTILKPVVYGFVLAYLLNPIMKTVEQYILKLLEGKIKKEEKLKKFARTLSVFASLIAAGALIVALANMVLPELYKSIMNMVSTVPGQLNDWMEKFNQMQLEESATGTIAKEGLTQVTIFFENWLRTDLLKQLNVWMSSLTEGVINIINGVMNLVIGIIISIYILFGKEKFSGQSKKIVYAVLKPEKANFVLHITRKSNDIFGGFIIGKLIDSAIIGVLCFIALTLMNMPYTMLVSVIVGVTNIIPFFGPYIGAIPSTLLILLTDPLKGVYFLIFILFLQQVDGNIIGPKILGDSTGLSAFWVVVAILLGGGLFGFVGMIMGVPTFAVLYYLFQTFIDRRLERKNLPTDFEKYDENSYVDAQSGEFISSASQTEEQQEENGEPDGQDENKKEE